MIASRPRGNHFFNSRIRTNFNTSYIVSSGCAIQQTFDLSGIVFLLLLPFRRQPTNSTHGHRAEEEGQHTTD